MEGWWVKIMNRLVNYCLIACLILSICIVPALAVYSEDYLADSKIDQLTAEYQEAPCAYSIYPESAHFSKMGGIFSVSVDASEYDCKWATQEKLSWVSVSLGSSQGSKPVIVQVGVNVGPPRSGAVGIAGHMFSITQD